MKVLLILYVLNAHTGSTVRQEIKAEFNTVDECTAALLELGPVAAKNGEARIYMCAIRKEVST